MVRGQVRVYDVTVGLGFGLGLNVGVRVKLGLAGAHVIHLHATSFVLFCSLYN